MSSIKEFAIELRNDLPSLDLHGLFTNEIDDKIDQFLFECFNKNEPGVRIVVGVGAGKIHEASIEFLSKHPLVEKVLDKGGTLVVLLAGKK